jgi:hypothetical protein
MVSSRRSSAKLVTVEVEVKSRKRKQNTSPEMQRKKLKKEEAVFDFPDDDGEPKTPVKNGAQKKSPKVTSGRKLAAPNSKASGIAGNAKPIPRISPKKSTQSKESSPDPDPTELSEDELDLRKTPYTPVKQPAQTPTKSKSTRRNGVVPDLLPSPVQSPIKPFQQKLVEDKRKQKRNEANVLSEQITINGTEPVSQPSVKAPTAEELDEVKQEVLGKLTGRNPIPLIGHVAERAKYILFRLI